MPLLGAGFCPAKTQGSLSWEEGGLENAFLGAKGLALTGLTPPGLPGQGKSFSQTLTTALHLTLMGSA